MMIRTLSLFGLAALLPVLQGCVAAAAVGVGTVAMVAEDRRTTGIYFEDQNIELKVQAAVAEKYQGNDQVQVKVTSFNRFVLLNGEVPTEEIRRDAGVIALGIENVRNVQNEILVAAPSSFSQRSRDTATTSTVLGRFVSEAKFQANHVKVVTRNDTVYLMGIVTPAEAQAATEIARTTGGVQKVVRVFEVTDNP